LEKRKGKGLDFEKSLSIILEAVREARFLSYRELADANGADWSQVRYAIGGHLWKLAEYGHLKERLLLSAIVVNKPNVETGKMEPDTLKGFIGAARELGYPIPMSRRSSKSSKRVCSLGREGNRLRPHSNKGC
jgi:hypothetical protein